MYLLRVAKGGHPWAPRWLEIRNILTPSARQWAKLFPRPCFPYQPSSRTSREGSAANSLCGHGRRKEEASLADGRLNTLTLCLLESLEVFVNCRPNSKPDENSKTKRF